MTPMELDFARWIMRHGGRFRLRQLVPTRFIYEYRRLVTRLRLYGYVIHIEEDRKRPGRNLYTVIPPGGEWRLPVETRRRVGRPSEEELRERKEPFFEFIDDVPMKKKHVDTSIPFV